MSHGVCMSDLASFCGIFKFWRLPKAHTSQRARVLLSLVHVQVILGLVQLLYTYRSPEFAARRMEEAKFSADHAIFQTSALTEIRPGRNVMLLDLTHQAPSLDDDDAWTVFFIHGSMATMQQFEAQIVEMHQGSKCRVLAYDAYGCGKSPRPHDYSAYSQQNSLLDLIAVFDRYKGRKNVIVGHSYGSSQVVRLATARSQLVHGLVMIGPAFAPSHFPAKVIKVFSAPLMVLNMIRPLLSRGFAERAFHARTRQQSCPAHRRLLTRAEAFSGTNSMHVCQAFYQQMEWVDSRLLEAIPCAVLLLVGEGDKVTPVGYARAIDEIVRRNSKRLVTYKEIKDASHQVMQETPDQVCAHIKEFLQKLEEAPVHPDTETVEM